MSLRRMHSDRSLVPVLGGTKALCNSGASFTVPGVRTNGTLREAEMAAQKSHEASHGNMMSAVSLSCLPWGGSAMS